MKRISCLIAGFALLGAGTAYAQGTLDAVQKKGFVQCGVNGGAVAGFSAPDSQGVWKGIDVDLCRAVAAAVFGDANKVRYTGLTAQQRFTALQSGEVDILSRNTTWTITRDTSLGLNFVGVNFYDGQGFMVPGKLNVKQRQAAQRRHGVRAARHHHRAQPLRLLPRQRHDLQAGGDRDAAGSAERLLLRAAATCSPPTSRAWFRRAPRARRSPTTTSSCPK